MPKDTKTALLNSAEAAARAAGFDGFSYADLAADVGIRKASIHHHFPTKAALATALMGRYRDRLAEACDEIDASHATAAERMRALIAVYREALAGGQSLCLCVSLSTSRDSLPPEVIARMTEYRAMMTAWIETLYRCGRAQGLTRARHDGTIADAGDPGAEAAATLALLEGAQLAARTESSPERFDQATRMLKARLA